MSSTIKAAITALKEKVAAAYSKISDKGGTLPTTQDAAGLADAIDSIPAGGGKVFLKSLPSFSSMTNDDLGLEYIDFEGRDVSCGTSMWRNCTNLKKIDLSGSNAASLSFEYFMCDGCTSLEEFTTGTIPCTTSNSTGSWRNCKKLKGLDLRYWTITNQNVTWAYCTSIEYFRVGEGFGVSVDLSGTAMQHDAILQLFNDLPSKSLTLTLGKTKLALMTDDEKTIATDKGWTLA